MKSIFFDCGTRDTTASIGILALRIMTGLMMFIGHGLPKLRNYAMLKDKFEMSVYPFQHFAPSRHRLGETDEISFLLALQFD